MQNSFKTFTEARSKIIVYFFEKLWYNNTTIKKELKCTLSNLTFHTIVHSLNLSMTPKNTILQLNLSPIMDRVVEIRSMPSLAKTLIYYNSVMTMIFPKNISWR